MIGVRSLYGRILVVSFGTLLAAAVAFVGVFVWVSRPSIERRMGPLQALQALQLAHAIEAIERGGVTTAREYLAWLDGNWPASHYLLDARGRDVLDGADRAALLASAARGAPPRLGRRFPVAESSADGRYHLVAVVTRPFTLADLPPYYAVILIAVGASCWWLATSIALPLRDLSRAVDRVGRDGLQMRSVHSRRRDEIGVLARSFDGMAARIQSLLAAERRLLQDVSHELRSPLARMTVAIELSRASDDREAAAQHLTREVTRLSELVGLLLDVTREDEREPRVEVDVRALLSDAVDTCAIEAAARECALQCRVEGDGQISGRRELIRRAAENVLRNAIRFAPPGTDVDVTMRGAADTVTIEIRDRGPGVPAADLSSLGEPFFRAGPSRDPATGGVGLGLSIARRAVLAHDGTFSVENAHPGLRVRLSFRRVSLNKT